MADPGDHFKVIVSDFVTISKPNCKWQLNYSVLHFHEFKTREDLLIVSDYSIAIVELSPSLMS